MICTGLVSYLSGIYYKLALGTCPVIDVVHQTSCSHPPPEMYSILFPCHFEMTSLDCND